MISQTRAGVTTWFHNIHNGPTNVTHLTNASGVVAQRYEFEAFGNLTYQSGSTTNNYRFQTKELHSKSNLVYFGSRWYNPAIGRWITPDPLGMVDGPNLYTYLNNNPINLLDSWGLCGAPPWGQPWWVKTEKGKRYFVANKVEVGYSRIFLNIFHTFIRVSYKGQTKMMGFNASNSMQIPFTLLGMNIPGKVSAETGKGATFIPVKIIDSSQAMIVYNLVDSGQFNWSSYNYRRENCYNWVESVLSAAGINPPDDLPWR